MNNNINKESNEAHGIIYKITNKINGKCYIGQTTRSVRVRVMEHINKNYIISRAIKKYGLNNFDVNVIDEGENMDDLNDKEIKHISRLNCLFPNGYNMCVGGNSTTGYRHTDGNKLIMNEEKKGLFIGRNNPFYNRTHTDEQKKKWSKTRKGRDMTKVTEASFKKTRIKVIDVDSGKVYESVQSAAGTNGLKATHISRVCRGKRKRTGGIRWMYLEDYGQGKESE